MLPIYLSSQSLPKCTITEVTSIISLRPLLATVFPHILARKAYRHGMAILLILKQAAYPYARVNEVSWLFFDIADQKNDRILQAIGIPSPQLFSVVVPQFYPRP